MNNQNSKTENEMYFTLKSRLYGLVFNIFAISQVDQIVQTLEDMRGLADDNLQDDFAACEGLVQRWINHWFPSMQ